jgi:voltage-gated potassium channel
MESLRIDRLRTPARRSARAGKRIWREWCFVRAILARRGISLVLLLALLATGGLLFQVFEEGKGHSFVRSMYFTWSLVFAQPPESFPESRVLQAFFFLVPVFGLTVIIEAILEISSMIRDRRRNDETWCKIMASSMKDHVILVGLGRLGIRTYHLLRKLGHDVVVIDSNASAQFLDDVRRDGSPVLIGDARREEWLEEANVKQARSIIIATTDDLANLEIALDARRSNPHLRVVMRMFDPNMAEKVKEGFQIRAVMSAASLAAPAFAMAALERGIVNSIVVDDRLVVSQRWSVERGGRLDGKSIADVMSEHGVGVVEHRSASAEPQLFPRADARLAAGDELLVQGRFEDLVGHALAKR